MTAEPNNLTGINAFNVSGICSNKVVGLDVTKPNGTKELIQLTKSVMRPSRRSKVATKTHTRAMKKSQEKGLAGIEANLINYRPDLTAKAQAKFLKIRNTFKKPKLSKWRK